MCSTILAATVVPTLRSPLALTRTEPSSLRTGRAAIVTAAPTNAAAAVRLPEVSMAEPHCGQESGMTISVWVPSRSSTTGPTTRGMIFFASVTSMVSPSISPRRVMSPGLCRVA